MCKLQLVYMQAESSIRRELEAANITVMSRVFSTNGNPREITDLFVSIIVASRHAANAFSYS